MPLQRDFGDDDSETDMTNSSDDWWNPVVPGQAGPTRQPLPQQTAPQMPLMPQPGTQATPTPPLYGGPAGGFGPPAVPQGINAPGRGGPHGTSPARSKRSSIVVGGAVVALIVAAAAVFSLTRGSDSASGSGRGLFHAVRGPDPTKTKLKLNGFLTQATIANGVLYVAVTATGGDASSDVEAFKLGAEPTEVWHKSIDGGVRQLRVISGGLAVLTGTSDANSNPSSETIVTFKNLSDGSDLWKTTVDDQSLFADEFSVPMLRGFDSGAGGTINYHLLSMTEHKVTKTVSVGSYYATVVGGRIIALDSGRVRSFDANTLQAIGNGFSADDNASGVTAVGGNIAVGEGTDLVLYNASGKEVTRDNVSLGTIGGLVTIGTNRILAYGDKGTKVLDLNGKNFDEAYSTKSSLRPAIINGRAYGLVDRSTSAGSLVNLDSKNVDEIGTFKPGTSDCGDGEGPQGEDDGLACYADRLFDGAIYSLSGGTLTAYSLDKVEKIYSIHTTGRVLALDGAVLDATYDSASSSTTLQIFQ